MANSTHKPLVRFGAGYGRQVLDKLRTGSPWSTPYLPILWKVRFDFADITAAATTKTLVLNTHAGTGKEFPANVLIKDVWGYLHTTFDGGATSELTLQVGDTGDPDGLVTAHSIHEDGSGVAGWQQFTRGVQGAGTLGARPEAAYEPNALLTSTGANISTLTQGNITLIFELVPIEVPAAS